MNTALALVPDQPDLFPEQVQPNGIALSPEEQRVVQQALVILEEHLHQPGFAFTSPEATRDWLRLQLAPLERETFLVLLLDSQHRLITHDTLFTGSINHVEVQPREVVRMAMNHNAAAVIVAHNHPSGEAEPSLADRKITERLNSTLQLVDVRLLDHVVVGHRGTVSLAERGWL